MKKYFVGLFTALALSLSLLSASPAQAASGLMTEGEFLNICASNCGSPWAQYEVEDNCNCTGDIVKRWSENGFDFKRVNYNNSYQVGGVNIKYRRNGDGSGFWRVRTKTWCDASGCVTFPL